MFRSALVKLTVAYLGILMVISLGFSLAVYHVSVNALDESLRLQIEAIERQPRFRILPPSIDLQRIHDEQLKEGRERILIDLLIANFIVLVAGGFGSYWLAGRTLKPIEEALEAQSRFTADASHELRTPLTAMRTEIEVALRDKKLKLEDARRLLGSNLEEIDKLRQLANGLLTLSWYQSGDSVSFTAVDVKGVADEAVQRLAGAAKAARATVKVEGESIQVMGERESLIALVTVLVDNAIKYGSGKPRVGVRVRKVGRRAVLAVTDNGVGIAKADQAKIFDRFYRADSSRSKRTDGYGLGLSIARQIVDMHHGDIQVESEPKKGTTMTVSLPVTQPKNALPV